MFNNLLKKQKQDLECQLEEIEKTIQIKTNRINELNSQIVQTDGFLRQINQNIVNSKRQIEEYKLELGIAEGIITMQELGMEYTPNCNDLNELAVKKVNIQKSIASLIGNNKAIITTRVYRIDGSEAKGKKFQKVFCENLLIGFNSYFNKKKKSITAYNYNSSVELIKSKFDKINQKASLMGVSINSTYLDLSLIHI